MSGQGLLTELVHVGSDIYSNINVFDVGMEEGVLRKGNGCIVVTQDSSGGYSSYVNAT